MGAVWAWMSEPEVYGPAALISVAVNMVALAVASRRER
jgi:hypothetical protein